MPTGLKPSTPGREFLSERLDTKIELLLSGSRVSTAAKILLGTGIYLMPDKVRSGSSGGIELSVDGLTVNVPVQETFCADSPWVLDAIDGGFVLANARNGHTFEVEVARRPEFYDKACSSGQPMRKIGKVCGDRLGIAVVEQCELWRKPDTRCKFCAYGSNLAREAAHKSTEDIVETVESALSDRAHPIKHVMLTGGTTIPADAGCQRICEVAAAISESSDVMVSAMFSPPNDGASLGVMRESGVSEVAINIEVYDSAMAAQYIPGKHSLIGRSRYMEALSRSVEVFGKGNVRSLLVVGLETMNSCLEAVERLVAMGVIPVFSPLRPLPHTALHGRRPPELHWTFELVGRATAIAAASGLKLGPKCASCQNNTLAEPWTS